MKDLACFGLFIAVMTAAVLLVVRVGVAWECGNYEKATGKTTKMVGIGCYIQEGGSWMLWDEYKLRFATHGGGAA